MRKNIFCVIFWWCKIELTNESHTHRASWCKDRFGFCILPHLTAGLRLSEASCLYDPVLLGSSICQQSLISFVSHSSSFVVSCTLWRRTTRPKKQWVAFFSICPKRKYCLALSLEFIHCEHDVLHCTTGSATGLLSKRETRGSLRAFTLRCNRCLYYYDVWPLAGLWAADSMLEYFCPRSPYHWRWLSCACWQHFGASSTSRPSSNTATSSTDTLSIWRKTAQQRMKTCGRSISQ